MAEADTEPRVAPYEEIIIGQGVSSPAEDYIIEDESGAVIDCTGAAVRAKARRSFAATAAVLTWTGAVVNGPAGQVRLSYTAAASAAVKARSGVHDAEVELVSGRVIRFRQGPWKLSREVTK